MVWQFYPLFLYGLSFLIGLTLQPISFVPLLAILFSLSKFSFEKTFSVRISSRAPLAILVVLAGFCYSLAICKLPTPGNYYVGNGHLHPLSLTKKSFHGKPTYIIKGVLTQFISHEKIYKNIPVFIALNEKGPLMNHDWQLNGTLRSSLRGWIFKPNASMPLKKIKATYSLAELRHMAKEKVKKYIHSSIKQKEAASLISGLATGEFDDRGLLFDFSRFGLSHLLAISGFHFALLAGMIGFILKPFLSIKRVSIVLLVLLSCYLLFLGESPSILRAALTLFLFLLGPLIHQSSRAENALGLALLVILVYDPLSVYSVGFQLSFLCTAALITFFELVDRLLKQILPGRSAKNLYKLSKLERIPAVLMNYIRKSLALNLALTLTSLPAVLNLFHQFPLLSLFYNLFFPLMLSGTVFLFLLSIPFPFLHTLNSEYTTFLLALTHELPPNFDLTIQTKFFNLEITILLTTLLFYFGLHRKAKLNYTIN